MLLCLIITTTSYAQNRKVLQDKVQKFEEDKKKNDDWEASLLATIKESEGIIASKNEELKKLQDIITNRKSNKARIRQEVESQLDEMSTTQRMFGKKAGYFRCIREYIDTREAVDFPTCARTHPVTLEKNEQDAIKVWMLELGDSDNLVKIKIESAKREVTSHTYRIDNAKVQLVHARAQKELLASQAAQLEARKEDARIAEKFQHFVNCDEATPDISLEEKVPFPGAKFQGPFVGVPRDNQDGLGTCYANAAKNMLVGASQGKDVASFLDLALQYKKGNSSLVSSGLDAGYTCGVLTKLKETGYCPQGNAPMETGDKNLHAEGLIGGPTPTVWDQAIVVRLIQKFLQGKADLQKGSKEFSEKVLSQASFLIDNIKKNPNVKLPLPVVRNQIPGQWKILEYSALAKDKNPFFNEEKFLSNYRTEYRKFYPKYVRAVVEGKNRDEIFQMFEDNMKPFIDNYKLSGEMKYWKAVFMEDTKSDWNDPARKVSLNDSLNFLKVISGTRNKSDEEFLQFCDDTSGDMLHFIATLQPLIKHLKELKVDTKVLFGPNGKFKNAAELMQLVVAPACLNKEARKFPDYIASCDDGYGLISEIRAKGGSLTEQKRLLREKVVVNLVQGYAPGNNIHRHVNTIVGMRFNKTKKSCEYKIRESQTGESTWQDESKIFANIQGLAEVRRK